MNAEQLIKVLLELDQQVISHRPSEWGKAALLVADLCEYSEPHRCAPPGRLGDWESVDLKPIDRRAPGRLDQPVLDAILAGQAEPQAERGGMKISLSGVLDRTADFLDLHDEPDRAYTLRLLLDHLRELRADPSKVQEFFELYVDKGFEAGIVGPRGDGS